MFLCWVFCWVLTWVFLPGPTRHWFPPTGQIHEYKRWSSYLIVCVTDQQSVHVTLTMLAEIVASYKEQNNWVWKYGLDESVQTLYWTIAFPTYVVEKLTDQTYQSLSDRSWWNRDFAVAWLSSSLCNRSRTETAWRLSCMSVFLSLLYFLFASTGNSRGATFSAEALCRRLSQDWKGFVGLCPSATWLKWRPRSASACISYFPTSVL